MTKQQRTDAGFRLTHIFSAILIKSANFPFYVDLKSANAVRKDHTPI